MFTSTHYAGEDMRVEFQNGEPWKKVFGPVFIYLNSNTANGTYATLWNDAKRQVCILFIYLLSHHSIPFLSYYRQEIYFFFI